MRSKVSLLVLKLISHLDILLSYLIFTFQREYRKFIATNTPLSVYCSQNESSVLTQSTDRESQSQILRLVSHMMLARLLPPSEVHSQILMTFLSELWANQIFQTALDTICDSDWINCTIVEYLTDITPIDEIDEHDSTLFHELANSIEVAKLAEELNQPSDSSNFIDPTPTAPHEAQSSILSNGSTTTQQNQTNLFADFKTEICDKPTESVEETHIESKKDTENASPPVSPTIVTPTIASPTTLSPTPRSPTRSNKSINLQNILTNQETFAEFMAFLEERKSANLLRFWLHADSFRKIASEEVDINLVQEDALGIFKTYFGEAATSPIKVVDEGLIRQCVREIKKAPTSHCFMMLQEYVLMVMERDYFDDFIKSMRTQGEDMSFLIKDEHVQKETESSPENDGKSGFLSDETSVEEKFSNRFNTLDNSVLSSLPEENEQLQVNSRRSRSWSSSISAETLEEFDKNETSAGSYEIDDATENNNESIMDRQKVPMMDLTGVRIKMTEVSEAPNKYIVSTRSLGYMIEVEQPGSTGWIMTRNYEDFEKMHQSLVQAFPKAEKVTMPRLMLKRNREACEALERYLNILLSDVTLCESDALQTFMKRDGLPKKNSERSAMKKGLSILSAKSMSMVNILTSSGDSKSQSQHDRSYEESFSRKKSTDILKSSEAALKKFSELLPRISTDFSKVPEEISGKNSSIITRPSIETVNSATWGSSRTGTPTTASESDTSSIVMVDAPSDRSPIVENDVAPDSDDINSISKRRVRPNKQLTGQDIDLLIDTIFALVEEIFDLSVKSQWHLRRTVLSVLREVVRRSYTEAIKTSFLMYIDTLSTEEKVTSIIENFTNSFWPNGIWPEPLPSRTEEEKSKTKEEAKKLLLQKAVPSSIKQVMGSENSRIMIGGLVDGFLAEKEVVRGMGVNILESIVKLIIAE
jgi:hypothetical protein